ncbi:MAG: hypothetical protein CSA33_03730 [Desulfobulbus propionicus]|nr:MAG: hypothetical protein CSA33_03730 [Desulfobulbus propionicus]
MIETDEQQKEDAPQKTTAAVNMFNWCALDHASPGSFCWGNAPGSRQVNGETCQARCPLDRQDIDIL